MYKIGVVIIHYGDYEDTLKALQSCNISKSKKKFQLIPIIIQNQPNKQLIYHAWKISKDIIIPEYKQNYGFSEGNNIGIKIALKKKCSAVILLNNDAYFTENNLEKLLNYFIPSLDSLISPKIYFAPGYEYHNKYKKHEIGKVIWYAGGKIDWDNIYPYHRGVDEVDYNQYDEINETDFVTGCCMIIRKNLIDKIGFFDNKYFLYFEDVDFSIRAKKNGFKVKYIPNSYLYHKNAQSSGLPGSNLHLYYQTRNRLYFGFKYSNLNTKKSLFFQSIKDLTDRNKRKAVFDYYLNRMGKA
jgi:hypothetical protein